MELQTSERRSEQRRPSWFGRRRRALNRLFGRLKPTRTLKTQSVQVDGLMARPSFSQRTPLSSARALPEDHPAQDMVVLSSLDFLNSYPESSSARTSILSTPSSTGTNRVLRAFAQLGQDVEQILVIATHVLQRQETFQPCRCQCTARTSITSDDVSSFTCSSTSSAVTSLSSSSATSPPLLLTRCQPGEETGNDYTIQATQNDRISSANNDDLANVELSRLPSSRLGTNLGSLFDFSPSSHPLVRGIGDATRRTASTAPSIHVNSFREEHPTLHPPHAGFHIETDVEGSQPQTEIPRGQFVQRSNDGSSDKPSLPATPFLHTISLPSSSFHPSRNHSQEEPSPRGSDFTTGCAAAAGLRPFVSRPYPVEPPGFPSRFVQRPNIPQVAGPYGRRGRLPTITFGPTTSSRGNTSAHNTLGNKTAHDGLSRNHILVSESGAGGILFRGFNPNVQAPPPRERGHTPPIELHHPRPMYPFRIHQLERAARDFLEVHRSFPQGSVGGSAGGGVGPQSRFTDESMNNLSAREPLFSTQNPTGARAAREASEAMIAQLRHDQDHQRAETRISSAALARRPILQPWAAPRFVVPSSRRQNLDYQETIDEETDDIFYDIDF